MDAYFNSIEEMFSTPKERTFADRTEILQLLVDALLRLNEDPNYCQIYLIHGMGGIGKTRLVNEFSKMISPEPIIYVSFEIEKRSETINNLYRIRKTINSSCPFFDFALLQYWELTNPAILNDDFMNLFHKSFFTDLVDTISETIGNSIGLVQPNISPPATITPSTILDFANYLYRKIPQFRHSALFKNISAASPDELARKLPILLGVEIERLISKGKIENPVFIFDSYQESYPYSESEEWLLHLIKEIKHGLFVITSREEVHWENENLALHHLQCYPEADARVLLEETITNRPDLVDAIIESTQCVPIYIDLALNIFDAEKSIAGERLVEKSLFSDRHKLVYHFTSHMKLTWQSAVLNLATIQVFNYDIFIWFIDCGLITCAPYEYASIIKSNLFNYVSQERNSSLVKIHDVFCKDVQSGRSVEECYSIFQTYLSFICYRRDYFVQENQGGSLAALLQNILNLATSLEERLLKENGGESIHELDKNSIENLLDIFFTLVANKVRFVPPSYKNVKTRIMKKICQFIYVKTYEKNNTAETIIALEEIGDVSCFGKHQISYEAVLYYAKSLAGHYNELENWIEKIESKLTPQEKSEWFYNRIKIYQADCNMLKGKFKTALSSLILLKNNYNSIEDQYTIDRTIGHIYRFNFQLSEALDAYQVLLYKYNDNPILREYLLANIAETNCYFPSPNYIEHTMQILKLMSSAYNAKNKGKVLYALAIANTVKGHYRTAQTNIDECIMINRRDGYQSGELFGYMAQAYLDYALTGTIGKATNSVIENFLAQNKAYTFFRLQLAIMADDYPSIHNLKTQYEWIDFKYTETMSRQFLLQFRNT